MTHTIAVSVIAILASVLIARGLKWLFVDGKPAIDPDYEPGVKAWARVTADEECT